MTKGDRVNLNPMTWDVPYALMVAALFIIVFVRAHGTYWVGRLIGSRAERTRARRLMESPGYQRAVVQLNQWGPPVVTVSFLTIGFQTLVNLAAGATRMPLVRYLPAMAIGGIAWAFIYATVGFVGFEALAAVWRRSPALAISLGVVCAAALGGFIAWRVRAARGTASTPTQP